MRFEKINYTIVIVTSILLFGCKDNITSKQNTEIEKDTSYTAYTNPVMWADVPDMSITRKDDTFYLISTTMHLMPGAPVMTSKDLVHWEIASYVFDSLTDTPKYNLKEGTVYGRGQWASSIRYHNGEFYVLFSPNDEPFKSYFYKSKDPKTGNWELISRMKHFHDASLFFDDDGKVYAFYGTGELTELKPDLSGVMPGGIDIKIFERDSTETGLLEGSQVVKHNGKYYLLMISWPRGEPRRQLCYRADNITGPYEKKMILESEFAGFYYAGQGAIIDDVNGNWHALIFQDRNGVGRVPLLMPVTWEDGWPMLGDEFGKVPLHDTIPLKPHDTGRHIVESDEFNSDKLKINWQWNHNPINNAWSLIERPGYLRLKTNRVVDNLYLAPNTLTQRMEGPTSKGIVSLNLSGMKDGDRAGFAAFNGDSGILRISNEEGKKTLRMVTNVVALDPNTKAVTNVEEDIKESVEINEDIIYLKIEGDFNVDKDIAKFYYSLDNKKWTQIGPEFKMIFDWRRLFMGTKFAIFNYATKTSGGHIDVDYFHYERHPENLVPIQ